MRGAFAQSVPGALIIQLQPQVSFRDGAITGAESLARWRLPDGRCLGPADFLTLLGVDWSHPMFGRELMQIAVDTQVELVATDRSTRLWVNLSPTMLESVEWIEEWLVGPCRDAGIDVTSFGFELTETALLRSLSTAQTVLATLEDMGAQVALDDFGTASRRCRISARYRQAS